MNNQDNDVAVKLGIIPGLLVKEIHKENGEFIATLEYLTKKSEKTYRLVAGSNGLRFELNSFNMR